MLFKMQMHVVIFIDIVSIPHDYSHSTILHNAQPYYSSLTIRKLGLRDNVAL